MGPGLRDSGPWQYQSPEQTTLRGIIMRREYDVFERFPDGSSIWRATVSGRFETQRKIQEFAEHSQNNFFTIEIEAGELIPFQLTRRDSRPLTKARAAAS